LTGAIDRKVGGYLVSLFTATLVFWLSRPPDKMVKLQVLLLLLLGLTSMLLASPVEPVDLLAEMKNMKASMEALRTERLGEAKNHARSNF